MTPQMHHQSDQTPNFDFIMKQGGGEPIPKKRDKKVVVLMVLLVILGLVVIGGAIFSSVRNVEQESAQQSVNPSEVTTEQQTVQKFLGYIRSGDYDQARALIVGPEVTTQAMKQQVDEFWNRVAIDDCKLDQAIKSKGENPVLSLVYSCPINYEQPLTAKITFTFSEGNQNINGYQYRAEVKQP